MRPGDDNEVSLPNSRRSLSPPPSTVAVFKCVRQQSALKCCSGIEEERKKEGDEGVGEFIFEMGGVGESSRPVCNALCVQILAAAS